jgi:hypothetical protein
MAASKFLKTPNLGVVLQITEIVPSGIDGRVWVVHDVERNRGFRVMLPGGALNDTPPGRPRLGRKFREDEIEGALGLAIERALTSPPEKVPGTLYEVEVESRDLYDLVALVK